MSLLCRYPGEKDSAQWTPDPEAFAQLLTEAKVDVKDSQSRELFLKSLNSMIPHMQRAMTVITSLEQSATRHCAAELHRNPNLAHNERLALMHKLLHYHLSAGVFSRELVIQEERELKLAAQKELALTKEKLKRSSDELDKLREAMKWASAAPHPFDAATARNQRKAATPVTTADGDGDGDGTTNTPPSPVAPAPPSAPAPSVADVKSSGPNPVASHTPPATVADVQSQPTPQTPTADGVKLILDPNSLPAHALDLTSAWDLRTTAAGC